MNESRHPSLPLFQAASHGDSGALEDLIELNLEALRAFVHLNVGPGLAEKETPSDLVQSACREVLEDARERAFPTDGQFRRWLFNAALRKIRDKGRYWKAEKRDVAREAAGALSWPPLAELAAAPGTPSQAAMEAEAAARFHAAYDELTGDYRAVFDRVRMFGMSYGEIAAELGKTEVNVRKIYTRAVARLVGRIDGMR